MKQEIIQKKLRNKFLKQGVKMASPDTIFFSNKTKIGKNVSIEPYVVFIGKVILKNNITIKSFSHLEDVKIENNVSIGPYARLRPGTTLGKGSKVGNFVEVKNTSLASKAKANHLTYIGDAKVGANTNIGAGTIFCNYDGKNKHRSVVGDNVFIGSNASLIAPLKIGDASIVAAGSVINRDVPSQSLAIARPIQQNKLGLGKKIMLNLLKVADKIRK